MSTETVTRKGLLNAASSGPQDFYYQPPEQQHHHHHQHLYNPSASRISALASPRISAARARAKRVHSSSSSSSSRRSISSMTRQQQRRASQQLEPQHLHPISTLVAVVFDFFLRGILDLTWPFRELVRVVVRGVFTSLDWAYHAFPMPLALGLFYYGFQSVPDGFRNVEALRALHSSARLDGGARLVKSASSFKGLYGLGEMALVKWGDLGVQSGFYCLALLTAAYTVMLLIEMHDYVRDTWALIRDEALEVKALRADESNRRPNED